MAVPATPQNLNVSQGNGQVYLQWDLTAGAITYDVQRSTDNVTFASIATAVATNYLDTAVVVQTQYYYKIAATNGSGTGIYTSAQAVIPTLTGQLSLGQIRLMAQQRADRVNSDFVTQTEWNSYIVQSYFELYDLLVDTFEDYYLAVPYIFTTDGTQTQYNLPDGSALYQDINNNTAAAFYKLRGVDLGLQSTNNLAKVTIKKFEFIQRNRYIYPNLTATFFGIFNLRYRLMGNTLMFIPLPGSGQQVTVWYVPRLTQPLKDTDVLDGVSGWTEYVIVDAAIKALQKEESDVSVLMVQKQMLLKRIEDTGNNRDIGEPDTISNTRRGDWQGGGFDSGSDGSWGGM